MHSGKQLDATMPHLSSLENCSSDALCGKFQRHAPHVMSHRVDIDRPAPHTRSVLRHQIPTDESGCTPRRACVVCTVNRLAGIRRLRAQLVFAQEFVDVLSSNELDANQGKFRIEQRLIKSRPKSLNIDAALDGPPIVPLIGEAPAQSGRDRSRWLAWAGIVARHGTVRAVDKSITVDPLREYLETVPLDGPDGILSGIPAPLQQEFDRASLLGTVGACSDAAWQSLESALRAGWPGLWPSS